MPYSSKALLSTVSAKLAESSARSRAFFNNTAFVNKNTPNPPKAKPTKNCSILYSSYRCLIRIKCVYSSIQVASSTYNACSFSFICIALSLAKGDRRVGGGQKLVPYPQIGVVATSVCVKLGTDQGVVGRSVRD